MKGTFTITVGLCLFFSIHHAGMSQHIDVDTKEIESIIDEWNFANNNRSLSSFENVYGEQLLFYARDLSRSEVIALKQQMFQKIPGFKQKISTMITYTPYTSGVIKCDFIKEVLENARWRPYPSYLLVSYEDNRYRIVGESDYAMDRTVGYNLEIGEPIKFEGLATTPDPFSKDSLGAYSSPGNGTGDSIFESLQNDDLLSLFPPLASMGTVTIPKGYIIILVAFLAVGGLTIFIADSVQSGKRKKKRGVSLGKSREADTVIEEFKTQSVFEAFVITLFDPLFFQHRRPKAERIYAGKVSEGESGPDLEFDFKRKETHAQFAIKCLYLKSFGRRELKLSSPRQEQALRDFEEDTEMDLYYVIGIGGTPDDPNELFLVPLDVFRGGFINRERLNPYRKSGMFFYNRTAQRLQ